MRIFYYVSSCTILAHDDDIKPTGIKKNDDVNDDFNYNKFYTARGCVCVWFLLQVCLLFFSSSCIKHMFCFVFFKLNLVMMMRFCKFLKHDR